MSRRKRQSNKQKEKSKMSKLQKNSIIIGIVGGIVAVLVGIFPIRDILHDLFKKYVDTKPNYVSEMKIAWESLESGSPYRQEGDDGTRFLYFQSQAKEQQPFYEGVKLNMIYHNLSDEERVITGIKVIASNIVENLEPMFFTTRTISPSEGSELLSLRITNYGWGQSDAIHVTNIDFSLSTTNYVKNLPNISFHLRDHPDLDRSCSSISPGETSTIPLFFISDLNINGLDSTNDHDVYFFDAAITINSQMKEDTVILRHALQFDQTGLHFGSYGEGGINEVSSVIWIDTSKETCVDEYSVVQFLPAKESTVLPFFFFPSKSCSMSLTVEFETLDKKTITAEVLENAEFIVPYYEGSPSDYVDGRLLSKDYFNSSHSNIKVFFPFNASEFNPDALNQNIPSDSPSQSFNLQDVHVGDTVSLGRYEQDNNHANGSEDIEWTVLAIEGQQALFVSKRGLERKAFEDNLLSATWASSSLRQWLNDDFYYEAFQKTERNLIIPHLCSLPTNPRFSNVYAGGDTEDRVFLLSEEEVKTYLPSDRDRQCPPTDYLIAQGSFVRDGFCWWWLRNPGDSTERAMGVTTGGWITYEGTEVYDMGSVRPAIWVDIS